MEAVVARWGQPSPKFPSVGFSCSQTEEEPVTHFLLPSVCLTQLLFPKGGWLGWGFPQRGPYSLSSLWGAVSCSQRGPTRQLPGPHIPPQVLSSPSIRKGAPGPLYPIGYGGTRGGPES